MYDIRKPCGRLSTWCNQRSDVNVTIELSLSRGNRQGKLLASGLENVAQWTATTKKFSFDADAMPIRGIIAPPNHYRLARSLCYASPIINPRASRVVASPTACRVSSHVGLPHAPTSYIVLTPPCRESSSELLPCSYTTRKLHKTRLFQPTVGKEESKDIVEADSEMPCTDRRFARNTVKLL